MLQIVLFFKNLEKLKFGNFFVYLEFFCKFGKTQICNFFGNLKLLEI